MPFLQQKIQLQHALLGLAFLAPCTMASTHTEELVVTGTRTQQLASDSTVKVESISQGQLKKQHALDLNEGLKTIPGILLKDIRGKEGSQAWIQGISGNRVLVVIDGEPVTPSTGSTVDLTQISVSDIKKVEIIKGATSVLYGSQAMGGVINVITAKPEMGLHGSIQADGGSYGEQNPSGEKTDISRKRVHGKLGFANNWFYAQGDINARFSDGFQKDYTAWSQQGADGHKINGSFLLGFTPTENTEYSIRHEVYDQEQHTRLTTPAGNKLVYLNKQDDATRVRTTVKGQWFYESGDFWISAFTEDYENISMPQSDVFTRRFETPSNKVAMQWNHDISDNNTLTLGSSYFEESLTETKTTTQTGITVDELGGKKTRDNIDIYLQDDWQLGAFKITPGVRWQDDSDFGGETTFALNTKLDFTEHLYLRAGFGQGYRVPNLKERYFIFDHSHLGYKVLGNPDLQPESSDSYQLGLTWQALDTLQLSAGLFRNELDNLIVEDYSYNESPTVIVYQYQNIAKALTQGAEFSVNWQSLSGFGLNSSYTYLEATDENTGERLKDRPKHQVKNRLSFENSHGLNLGLIYIWQSDEVDVSQNQESPAWGQWDIKATQTLAEHYSIYGGIDNITNEQRIFNGSYDNRPVAGRLVYLGFGIHF